LQEVDQDSDKDDVGDVFDPEALAGRKILGEDVVVEEGKGEDPAGQVVDRVFIDDLPGDEADENQDQNHDRPGRHFGVPGVAVLQIQNGGCSSLFHLPHYIQSTNRVRIYESGT